MLEIKNLNVSVDNKEILHNFNLKINDGEIHALLGPNGCGKSTICSAILSHPSYKKDGQIFFDNEDITDFSPDEVALKGIYLVSQSPMAIEGVNNIELLRNALHAREKKVNIFDLNKEINNVLDIINFDSSFVSRDINVGCSGGERKKTELLHLFMLKPKFIILDEIDSGLDVDSLNTIIKALKKYYEEEKPSILIISHQMKLLKALNPSFVHIINNKKIEMTGNMDLALKIEKDGFNETFKIRKNYKNE